MSDKYQHFQLTNAPIHLRGLFSNSRSCSESAIQTCSTNGQTARSLPPTKTGRSRSSYLSCGQGWKIRPVLATSGAALTRVTPERSYRASDQPQPRQCEQRERTRRPPAVLTWPAAFGDNIVSVKVG